MSIVGFNTRTGIKQYDYDHLDNRLEKSVIAQEFDSLKTYEVGDFCLYEGRLYKCAVAGTGEWNVNKWLETSVLEESISVDDIEGYVGSMQSSVQEQFNNIEQELDTWRTETDANVTRLENTVSSAKVSDSVSGKIVSFTDGAAIPVKSAVAYIEPEQELNGYDKPWPGGAGKNLLPGWFTIVSNGSHCFFSASSNTEFPIHLTAGTYTINVNLTGRTAYPNYYYMGENYSAQTSIGNADQARTFTITEEQNYRFWLYANPNSMDPIQESEIVNFQLERGDTATDWEPYENICPIGGTAVARVFGTGKNLLPQVVNVRNNGSYADLGISSSGYHTYFAPGTYTLKVDVINRDDDPFCFCYLQDSNAAIVRLNNTSKTPNTFTIKKAGWYRIFLYINVSSGKTPLEASQIKRFQLELGSEATEWEPYQGESEVFVAAPSEAVLAYGTRGKNLLPNNLTNQTKSGLTMTKNSDGSVHIVGTATETRSFNMPVNLVNGETYTASGITGGSSTTYQVFLQNSVGNATTAGGIYSGSKTWTQSDSAIVAMYRIRVLNGATVDFTIYPQIELGSVATEYEPYDGGTIYGGTVDFVTKKLTVDRGIIDIADCEWTYNSTYNRFESEQIKTIVKRPKDVNTSQDELICSKYKSSKARDTGTAAINGTVAIDANSGRIFLRDEAYTTVEDFVQANAGQKIVYPLATPQVYDVDCGTLSTLLGNNTVWCNTDNLDLEYYADVKMFVDKLFTIDDSLTEAGQAADAKKTGDELADLKGDLNDRIDDVESQIDDLKYVPIAINSFSLSPATVEKGSTVATINFSYTFNKTPTTLKLGTENLTPSSTSTQKTGLSVTSDTTYTLTATDSGSHSNPAASASKTATLHFYDKIHYGVASVPSAYNDSFLLTGLANHDLASGKAKTFTVNATSGKYIYFALPTSMGTPNFNVGGFDGGFTKAAEFSHTNASGYATTYAVYKSDNAGLGSTKVTVS